MTLDIFKQTTSGQEVLKGNQLTLIQTTHRTTVETLVIQSCDDSGTLELGAQLHSQQTIQLRGESIIFIQTDKQNSVFQQVILVDFDFGLVHSYFKGLILTITSITTFTSSFNACFFKCTLRTTLAARNHLIAIKEGFKQTSLLVHGANANHCIDQRNNVERNTDGIHSFNQLFTTRTHCTSDGISLLFHERPQQLVVDVLQTLLYDITVFQFQHGTHIADNTPGRQVHILVCIRFTQLHVKITAELINNTCAGQFLVLVVGRKLVVDDNCVFAQLGISNMVVQNQYGRSQVFQLFMVDIIITGRVGQDDKTIALAVLG